MDQIEIFEKVKFEDGVPVTPLGWRPPTEEDYEALETTRGVSSVDIEQLMAMPPRDTFLYRFLDMALRVYHNDPNYKWNHQYQKYGTCFPAGTLVLMADGTERPIEDIQIGDRVIAHTGIARKVLNVGKRQYSGSMTLMSLRGWPFPLMMTGEHPVAVVNDHKSGHVEWLPAEQLSETDRVLMPYFGGEEKLQTLDLSNYVSSEQVVRVWKIDTLGVGFVRAKYGRTAIPRYVDVDARLARLIGLYLAEGSCEASRVTFTFSSTEELLAAEVVSLLESIFGVKATTGVDKAKPSVRRVRCNDTTVAQFFSRYCPGKALTKRVPSEFFRSPRGVKLALLRGWLDGDGHLKETEDRLVVVGVTSSLLMNRDFHRLSIMCGIKPSSTVRKKESHQRAAATVLEFCGHEASHASGASYEGRENDTRYYKRSKHGFACRIADLERYDDELDVFNLEVEEEHSYVANGIAVHNCVGQASKVAADDLMAINSILYGMEFPGRAAVAGSYTFARVEVANQPGRWEGANGVNAAAAFLKFGVLLLKHLNLPDNATDADENLAMQWTASRAGVPQTYEDMAQNLLVEDVIAPTSVKMAGKLIQAGAPIFVGTTYLPTGKCNSQGVSPCQRTRGGHEMAYRAVVWENGDPKYFLQQQSWYPKWATGGKLVADQPPESIWVTAADAAKQIADGDCSAIIGTNGLKYKG